MLTILNDGSRLTIFRITDDGSSFDFSATIILNTRAREQFYFPRKKTLSISDVPFLKLYFEH